jgi:hypothetical protein
LLGLFAMGGMSMSGTILSLTFCGSVLAALRRYDRANLSKSMTDV